MFKGAWGVSLTFESLVAIRSRVLQRLEMGVDGDGGEALCDAALDLLQQFVTLLHCPDARNQYVERCKSPSARAPRPHRVKADSASAKFVEHMLEDFALSGGQEASIKPRTEPLSSFQPMKTMF